MMNFASTNRLPRLRRHRRAAMLAVAVAGAGLAAGSLPLAAQDFTYNRKAMNDLSQCAPGKGPAVRVAVSGLKSSSGYLFVRTYPARSSDWLKSRRYVIRIETTPKQGSMTVCVPLPAPGDYAMAVQHDANGNRDTDFSTDGAGMSNNPEIKTFLGIPRPPSVDKVRFTAGKGITPIAITVKYL
jgi:uncharacterized protein (DUF2141 family)